MFQITKDRTPILSHQSDVVKSLATQFNQNYAGKNSVKVRAAWGKLLEQIRRADLNCVNSDGQPLKGTANQTPEAATFVAICRELGIPRSTAYLYIQDHITVSSYPQAVQDAAADAGLNLALDHVQAFYATLTVTDADLSNPNAVRGIIAQLEDAPNPTINPSKKSVEERLISMLRDLFKFTMDKKDEVDSGLIGYCMGQAAKSLTAEGLETWQAVMHQQAIAEKASHQVAETAISP
jgi:hypothetical protein